MWRQGNISTDSWTEGSSGHSWFWQATLACLPLSNEALALAGGWGTHHHFTSTTGCMYHKHHNACLPWLQNCTMCLQRLLSASLHWLLPHHHHDATSSTAYSMKITLSLRAQHLHDVSWSHYQSASQLQWMENSVWSFWLQVWQCVCAFEGYILYVLVLVLVYLWRFRFRARPIYHSERITPPPPVKKQHRSFLNQKWRRRKNALRNLH